MISDYVSSKGRYLIEMGVGPQEHLDIIDKTFKKCVKKGLKRAFLEPKTHF